jgi:hypothetical protein
MATWAGSTVSLFSHICARSQRRLRMWGSGPQDCRAAGDWVCGARVVRSVPCTFKSYEHPILVHAILGHSLPLAPCSTCPAHATLTDGSPDVLPSLLQQDSSEPAHGQMSRVQTAPEGFDREPGRGKGFPGFVEFPVQPRSYP